MKVLVTGCGRGGTNLGIELVRSLEHFNTTEQIEDRQFFNRGSLPDLYATKLATENDGYTTANIDKMMKENKDLHIMFMIRHPVDVCLSKLLRGRPRSQGGDSTIEQTAADGTLAGAAMVINKMYKVYKFLEENYDDRLLTVKMEELVTETDRVIEEVADFLNVPVTEGSKTFFMNNRNNYQKARYGNTLHKQVDLYKDLTNNFEGFFAGKEDEVGKIENIFSEIAKGTGYEQIV